MAVRGSAQAKKRANKEDMFFKLKYPLLSQTFLKLKIQFKFFLFIRVRVFNNEAYLRCIDLLVHAQRAATLLPRGSFNIYYLCSITYLCGNTAHNKILVMRTTERL